MKRRRSALWLSVVLGSALGTQGCVTAIFPAISALGSATSLVSWIHAQGTSGQARAADQGGLAGADPESMTFRIEFTASARAHLNALTARDRDRCRHDRAEAFAYSPRPDAES